MGFPGYFSSSWTSSNGPKVMAFPLVRPWFRCRFTCCLQLKNYGSPSSPIRPTVRTFLKPRTCFNARFRRRFCIAVRDRVIDDVARTYGMRRQYHKSPLSVPWQPKVQFVTWARVLGKSYVFGTPNPQK